MLHPVVGLFGLSSTISVVKLPPYPTKMRVHCPSVDCITLHLFEVSVPEIHDPELATVNSSVAVGRAVVLPPENPLMEVRMVKLEGVEFSQEIKSSYVVPMPVCLKTIHECAVPALAQKKGQKHG